MIQASLLISTYNWPEALDLCIKSVMDQSVLPAEIIICDDGSGQETRELVNKWKTISAIPVQHVWHKDEGFQLAKIRNRGFAAAKHEYLIQIDGDLILHRHFISDHIKFAQAESFTTGSRVLLSEAFSRQLFLDKEKDVKILFRQNNNMLNSLHLPLLRSLMATRYKNKGKWKYYVKGCNMAFWKKDILAVNGYNEAFTGWGREDSEIAIRLMNMGVQKRFLKFGGICYHLYHPEASRAMEAKNTQMMEDAITQKTIKAAVGINQYLQN